MNESLNTIMPVRIHAVFTSEISCDQDLDIIPGGSSSVIIGPITFPSSDGSNKDRMVFSSVGTPSFDQRVRLQNVTSGSATVLDNTTLVAVDFDGAVALTLPSSDVSSSGYSGMYVVDEGGNCSETNPITLAASTGTIEGETAMTTPYSSFRIVPSVSTTGWTSSLTEIVVPSTALSPKIIIRSNGTDPLSLAEVEVYDSSYTNVALNGTATQSTTTFSGDATRAIDGNTDGVYGNNSVSHTDSGPDEWWMLELDANADVAKIIVYNRTDAGTDRLAGCVAELYDTTGTMSYSATLVDTAISYLNVDNTFSYVIIRNNGTDALNLAEVEVYDSSYTNVALNGTATQSTTTNSGDASRAIDGNTNGVYGNASVTHTAAGTDEWWRLDFQTATDVTKIMVYNRTSTTGVGAARLDGCVLELYDASDSIAYASTLTSNVIHYLNVEKTKFSYIMVRNNGSDALNLAEVEAYDSTNTNIAVNGTATQSTTTNGGVASRAIDGNTDGVFNNGSVIHTSAGSDEWWRVDFQEATSLTKIVVYNRTDSAAVSIRLEGCVLELYDVDDNLALSFTLRDLVSQEIVVD